MSAQDGIGGKNEPWIRVIPTTNAAGRKYMNRCFTPQEVENILATHAPFIIQLVNPEDRHRSRGWFPSDRQEMLVYVVWILDHTCRERCIDISGVSIFIALLERTDREALVAAMDRYEQHGLLSEMAVGGTA